VLSKIEEQQIKWERGAHDDYETTLTKWRYAVKCIVAPSRLLRIGMFELRSNLTLATGSPTVSATMKRERPLKHFLWPLVIALLCYSIAYWGIEHRRNRKGPWKVSFTTNAVGLPELVINQPRVGVTNVRLRFIDELAPGEPGGTLLFDQPEPVPYDVPFGKCIFMDTTFLPGTVTFQLFGHEIELLPRVLIIDHEQYGWTTNHTISLSPLTNATSERVRP
jgi:hypothetical protein